MQTRKSNTLNGAVRALVAHNALSQKDADAILRAFSQPINRRAAWDGLVAKFGLTEDLNGHYVFSISASRNLTEGTEGAFLFL